MSTAYEALVERVAKAIEASLYSETDSPHGCRLSGPQEGEDVVIYGHVNLPALARAAIDECNAYIDDQNAALMRTLEDAEKKGPSEAAIAAVRSARLWRR